MCYVLVMDITADQVRHRFKNHPPLTPEAAAALDRITSICTEAGVALAEILPDSREASLAMTHLEEVSMFAKAAIARNQ